MPQPFRNAVITRAGARLLTRAQAGEIKIKFTRVAIGDGAYQEEEKTFQALQESTGLRALKNSYPISSTEAISDHSVKITALISNQDPVTGETLVGSGYFINEMGLFAREAEGEPGTDTLYSIAVTGGGNGDFMPPFNGHSPVQVVQEYFATVSNSAEVTVESAGAALLRDEFELFKQNIQGQFANSSFASALLNLVSGGDPSLHNGIYRGGKVLTDSYAYEDILQMVQAGDFSDIFIGDIIERDTPAIPATGYAAARQPYAVVGVNILSGYGGSASPPRTRPHLVLVPQYGLGKAKMNDSETTAGGYKGSHMNTAVLPAATSALETAFGAGHVLQMMEYLTTQVSTTEASMAGAGAKGASIKGEYDFVKAALLTEVQVYGNQAFSSSRLDNLGPYMQFPGFKISRLFEHGNNFWLRSVHSTGDFCVADGYAQPGYNVAQFPYTVRPYFVIG